MLAVSILPLVEVDAEFHEFGDALGAFGDDLPNGVLVAKTGSSIQRVSNVQLEGILVTHHTSHAALRPGCI